MDQVSRISEHVCLFLYTCSIMFAVFTFLPLVRDKYWIFRVLEYPRFQKLIIILFLLCAWIIYFFFTSDLPFVPVLLLLLSAVWLFMNIFPYTRLASKEVADSNGTGGDLLKIYTANVYQPNMNYSTLLAQISEEDPDLILLVETNAEWAKALEVLKQKYRFHVVHPQENTYGMICYSRFKLQDAEIKFLYKPEIPSLDAGLVMPSGRVVRIFGLHPEPPVPGENLRSTAKDRELLKVAHKVRSLDVPCIVLGDLNDVAWSHTTKLFKKVGSLYDVRNGRGFYSTFSAKSRILRFPLDYIFCTSGFMLRAMKRLPYNGSDHFPISISLVLKSPLA